jgi:ribokinase
VSFITELIIPKRIKTFYLPAVPKELKYMLFSNVMVNLVVTGSVALDNIKTPFGSVKETLGGAAVYSSYAASFFATPGIVSVVGEDFPKDHIELLRKKNISLEGLKIMPGKTFRWEGYYEYDMNQAHTLNTELNVFERFIPRIPEKYKKAEYLYLANIVPELQLQVLEELSPKLVGIDTMNYWIEHSRKKLLEVIKQCNILFINDAEARELFSTPSLVAAGKKVIDMGLHAAIIKKGEHGALLFTDGKIFAAPGYPLETIVDPTGAGDTFAGGVMGFLAKSGNSTDENLRKAIVYGSALASFDVEDFSLGKLMSINLNDIEKRYGLFKEIVQF